MRFTLFIALVLLLFNCKSKLNLQMNNDCSFSGGYCASVDGFSLTKVFTSSDYENSWRIEEGRFAGLNIVIPKYGFEPPLKVSISLIGNNEESVNIIDIHGDKELLDPIAFTPPDIISSKFSLVTERKFAASITIDDGLTLNIPEFDFEDENTFYFQQWGRLEFSELEEAKLISILIKPSDYTQIAGQSRQFQAIGVFLNESSGDITDKVTWSSSDTKLAVVSNNEKDFGKVTALKEGRVKIEASKDSISGSTYLTVLSSAAKNEAPSLNITEPSGGDDIVIEGVDFEITFIAIDGDDQATIALYRKSSNTGCAGDPTENGWTLLSDGLVEGSDTSFSMNTVSLVGSSYYICGKIQDSFNEVVYTLSSHPVTVKVNEAPILLVNQPTGGDDVIGQDDSFDIDYNAQDVDSEAIVTLYYRVGSSSDCNESAIGNWTQIASSLVEGINVIHNFTPGVYGQLYICAEAKDEVNEVYAVSPNFPGKITSVLTSSPYFQTLPLIMPHLFY